MGRRVLCWRAGCRMIVHILRDVYDLGRTVADWVGLAYLGRRKAYDTHVIGLECKRCVLCT